jgi:hypothetical protein
MSFLMIFKANSCWRNSPPLHVKLLLAGGVFEGFGVDDDDDAAFAADDFFVF